MRRPLVAGNWKMHGTRHSVAELLAGLNAQQWPEQVDLLIAPPALFIQQCREALGSSPLQLAGQDCAWQAEQGALTGEISPAQLRDAGCQYVLAGHAERRSRQGEQGALTGEISPAQLRDAGCQYVLVGHSERRSLLGESDELVCRKFAAALASGLRPILCVGETREQRDADETADVVGRQLQVVLD